MTTEKAVTDKVKSDRSILERIALYIPFYKGYRARNLRRDTDREVRMAVSKIIKMTKAELENIHREIIETGEMAIARNVERIRNKVDTYNTKVEKAVNGYSGIWATVKKVDEELDSVVSFDAKLLETADELRKFAEMMRNSIDKVGDHVKEFERKVDSLIEAYEGRELVLKGLTEA